MHPTQTSRSQLDRIVGEIADYPIDERMHRQMLERAKADGCTYAEVQSRVSAIVRKHGPDSKQTDAEIEVYLQRRQSTSAKAPTRRKRKAAARYDSTGSATVARERALPGRSG